MLEPEQRQLYVTALKPPCGYQFTNAVASTYSVDLSKLLSIPFALTMPDVDPRRFGDDGIVHLLHALREVTSKLTLFCERTGIAAPTMDHALYPMLESAVVEVAAPLNGCLHAKFWLVHFTAERDADVEPKELVRLVVMSRNLTHDRSWDVSVVLDGVVTWRNRKQSQPLADLLRYLTQSALRPMSDAATARVEQLAQLAWRTEWELPDGFEDLQFHVLGMGKRGKRWLPNDSGRLAIISPFVSESALEQLADSTRVPLMLVSRSEQLDLITPELLGRFERVAVLHDAAETEDGEDTTASDGDDKPRCLHAKVYVAESGWNTHLYLGSANATHRALVEGLNIELMVELSGKTSGVPGKGIKGLLADDGFGRMLCPYVLSAERVAVNLEVEQAERALADAAGVIAASKLELSLSRQDNGYLPVLSAGLPLVLPAVAEMQAWLITTQRSNARDARSLCENGRLESVPCSPESATGFVVFELISANALARFSFTLNVPIQEIPADREAHLIRLVLSNRGRLIQYLLSLLGDDLLSMQLLAAGSSEHNASASRGWQEAGLLERLVRARARHPERLEDVRHTIDALLKTPEGRDILPAELLELWNAVQPEEART